jgi:hypothetical protein
MAASFHSHSRLRPACLFLKYLDIGMQTIDNLFVWLVLICYERKVLLANCWWLVCCERKVLLAGGS